MQRQSFTILFDHAGRTSYFPGPTGESRQGHFPWEYAHPDYVDCVKESFQKCIETQEPQFHVGRLHSENDLFPDLAIACWLTPVKINQACSLPCVGILAQTVIVPPAFELLTTREREVLAKLASGTSPNNIAEQLGITRSTVDTYLSRVREKVELEDTLEVAVWATTYRDILELDEATCSDHLHNKVS